MGQPGFAADTAAVAHLFADSIEDEIVVEGGDGHHLARVRRVRVGERVTVADGHGAWREYVVADVRGGALSIEAVGPARVEPPLAPRLCVAFALTKGAKPEVVVRQLTELGIDALMPVIGERSVARRDEADEAVLVERLERVAREASMQSRRARLPELSPPSPLLALAGRPGLLLADRAGAPAAPAGAPPGGWTVLVGPEGGLSPSELEALAEAPRVGVGSHVLRAETAAVAVAALLAATRWAQSPGP
jgi:16S rRNA (uracil1498-N3)-methyltransferase